MQETLKAANPTCEAWDPMCFYHGLSNTYIFLVGYEFPEEVDYQSKEDLLEIFFRYFDEYYLIKEEQIRNCPDESLLPGKPALTVK